jgi:hypothetical protein
MSGAVAGSPDMLQDLRDGLRMLAKSPGRGASAFGVTA